MKCLLVVVLFSCIVGCKVQQIPKKSYIGLTKQELIADRGLPAETGSDGADGEVLVYRDRIVDESIAADYWIVQSVYVNANKIITRIVRRTENNPPTRIKVVPQQQRPIIYSP